MITLHETIVSSHDSLNSFLHTIKDNKDINNIKNILVAFENGKVRCVRRLGEFCIDPKEEFEEAFIYRDMTGVKFFDGTGIAVLTEGEKTNLKKLNKKEIKEWAKHTWKDGILIDWDNLDENHWPQVEASRESYDWK